MRRLHCLHQICAGILIVSILVGGAGCSARRSTTQARDAYLETPDTTVEGTKTRVQGALLGAAAGAALGAIVSLALGVDATGVGAAIGGGIGTAAGLILAENVVRERQHYADASAYLTARRKALESRIDAARDFNDALDRELEALEADRRKTEQVIADSELVLEAMEREIRAEQEALVEARREGVSREDVASQEERIGLLKLERLRLIAHIETLTGQRAPSPFVE